MHQLPCLHLPSQSQTLIHVLVPVTSTDSVQPLIQMISAVLWVQLALFFLIWGGIRWITSGGDKGKVEEARKHIVAAIIGLVVAFLAYFIIQIILTIFGLGSISTLQIPRF
jgi:hypothetical protein